jgi:hypothetical protein
VLFGVFAELHALVAQNDRVNEGAYKQNSQEHNEKEWQTKHSELAFEGALFFGGAVVPVCQLKDHDDDKQN